MNESQKAILHVFDEHVFGAMRTELDWALRGGAANLAALGLVTYTEFLGGILTGTLVVATRVEATSVRSCPIWVPITRN